MNTIWGTTSKHFGEANFFSRSMCTNPKSNTYPLKMDPETDPKHRENTEHTNTFENNRYKFNFSLTLCDFPYIFGGFDSFLKAMYPKKTLPINDS